MSRSMNLFHLLYKNCSMLISLKHLKFKIAYMYVKLATDGHWAPRSSPRFQESPAYFLLRAALFSCWAPPIRGDECEIERTNMFVLINVGKHSLYSSKLKLATDGHWATRSLPFLSSAYRCSTTLLPTVHPHTVAHSFVLQCCSNSSWVWSSTQWNPRISICSWA